MPATIQCDVAIVGGGLAGGLIALALRRKRPDCDVRVIEAGPRLGGNHLWSFFAGDVAPAERWLVAPLISYGWTGYDVAFPARQRTLRAQYYSVESERFDQVLREALPEKAVMTRRKALAASPTAVVLADGDRIEAKGVIDARGPGDLGLLELGWQKFLGRELRLADAHDMPRPIVMDATVPQADGYRFVYCLPFAATRMFVEDTYYSDDPAIDAPALAARIGDYAAARGWHVERVVREEAGVLPVAMGGDFDAYWQSGGNKVAKAGARAGLFHPVTSYSLPDAVRAAALVAQAGDLSGAGLNALLHGFARRTWRRRGYYRMLAKMLFRAAEPAERYRVLERFYGLDAGLIARFYAGRTTLLDQARLLAGRPPVPVGRAVAAVAGRKK
ncbi:lycopene beta-cyclase CrtY [Sphingomonas canadensis]|uniref:Lycopene beta-cyclase CrtY n=1 Tax=Sphingomonas canadensis TaxID=1219257 RepID=A0ABW3H769_9SPHN|nr:lycopene beta-cyclase CrtY [Sphingomonas canadensis]MCW3834619.1 lycopene beta-cyclase CrtY [Sphingomonas canadensis]